LIKIRRRLRILRRPFRCSRSSHPSPSAYLLLLKSRTSVVVRVPPDICYPDWSGGDARWGSFPTIHSTVSARSHNESRQPFSLAFVPNHPTEFATLEIGMYSTARAALLGPR
jgi:hypothetical protein